MSHIEISVAAGGLGMSRPRRCSGTRRRRRWGGLRQQWKLLGLFQIEQQHEFYSLTCMMKEGLAAALQPTVENAPTNDVSDSDFRLEVTQIHKGFTMETFAGPVFSSLRRSLGLTEQEYQQSLCSEKSYLQFISNSKSKADFFLTNDKRFFLKTQNKREIKFLLSNLKIYLEHLKEFPHSLLVKFLGVYRITVPHRLKKYFIVMQSVFYPDERINARYDIKGCEVSRWTEPVPEGTHVIVVLKDLNFEGQFITLDQQRMWLLRQVEIDTLFLRRLDVLDYSLLLAHQPLQPDELQQSLSFATLIMRTKSRVPVTAEHVYSPWTHTSVNLGSGAPGTAAAPEAAAEDDHASPSSAADNTGCWTQRHAGDDSSQSLLQTCPQPDAHKLPEFRAQNRRLLPNLKNPLHVIDGPEQRYFIGIIDIFTVYTFKKRLEHWWKRLRHPGQSFSTVSPQTYSARLCRWVQTHSK